MSNEKLIEQVRSEVSEEAFQEFQLYMASVREVVNMKKWRTMDTKIIFGKMHTRCMVCMGLGQIHSHVCESCYGTGGININLKG